MNVRVFRRVQFWASACLVAAFFLPWVSVGTFIGVISLPGYQMSDAMRQEASKEIEKQRISMRFDPTSFGRRPATPAQRTKATTRINAEKRLIVVSYVLYALPVLGLTCFIVTLGGTGGFWRRFLYLLGGSITLATVVFLYLNENDDGKFLEQASMGLWLTALSGATLLISVVLPGSRAMTANIAGERDVVPQSSR